jgi:hypothetical protein
MSITKPRKLELEIPLEARDVVTASVANAPYVRVGKEPAERLHVVPKRKGVHDVMATGDGDCDDAGSLTIVIEAIGLDIEADMVGMAASVDKRIEL